MLNVEGEFTFENRAGEPRDLPSWSGYTSPTGLYSPTCGTPLSPTCSGPPTYQNFTVEGTAYNDYNMFLTLAPGEEYTGAEVYEVPRRSDGEKRPQLTFVIRDIGRWDLTSSHP